MSCTSSDLNRLSAFVLKNEYNKGLYEASVTELTFVKVVFLRWELEG